MKGISQWFKWAPKASAVVTAVESSSQVASVVSAGTSIFGGISTIKIVLVVAALTFSAGNVTGWRAARVLDDYHAKKLALDQKEAELETIKAQRDVSNDAAKSDEERAGYAEQEAERQRKIADEIKSNSATVTPDDFARLQALWPGNPGAGVRANQGGTAPKPTK